MREKDRELSSSGISRRIFINRSVAGAGAGMILANAAGWPAWADSAAFEGTFTRMGRIVRDKEAGHTWMSWLKVELETNEIMTPYGSTRVTGSTDAVMVKSKNGGPCPDPKDISNGMTDAKLDPRIDARSGKVCVAWCACHPETKAWRVFANYSEDGKNWTGPMEVAGEEKGLALHPSVAIDPHSGKVWMAYEDWSDRSVKLAGYNAKKWSKPVRISRRGKNYRPKVIVTEKDGRHKGAVAVAWDSYRDLQYDIYLRLIRPGDKPGPELRVTQCARWDSCPDLMEDLEGNLWVAWVRASNELSEMNAMRDIHARFYDGERWFDPSIPEVLFNHDEFNTARLIGMGADERVSSKDALSENCDAEKGGGRITWYSVNWFPRLGVDARNRVYVFYRAGDPVIPPLYSHLDYRVYEGENWSGPERIKLDRGANILHAIWDLSVAVGEKEIEGLWGQGYINIGKTFWTLEETDPVRIRNLEGPRFHVKGTESKEAMHSGWPRRSSFKKPRTAKINGREHTLVFGDTHTHSWTSDGADPADYYYHFARDYAALDFFALSDHDFLVSDTPGIEAYVSFLPRYFSQPDFICFQAYEFTSSMKGHRVVVFEGDDRPTFPLGVFNTSRRKRASTTGQLYSFLHKFCTGPDSRVLVTAHNMFKLGNDFSQFDESLEPLYDVTSLHITAEKTVEEYVEQGVIDPKATSAMSALMNLSAVASGTAGKRNPAHKWFSCWRQILGDGLPLGAYGTSDTHAANGIGWITAGIWTKGMDRKSLFDAMFKRQSIGLDNRLRTFDIWYTYKAEDTKADLPVLHMDVRFWLDGKFMGSKTKLDSPPSIKVFADGSDPADPVRAVSVIRDGEAVRHEKAGGAGPVEFEWTDSSWKPGVGYYYVRVEFESGNLGFSSPVFTA